jgi:hypothetical protein
MASLSLADSVPEKPPGECLDPGPEWLMFVFETLFRI